MSNTAVLISTVSKTIVTLFRKYNFLIYLLCINATISGFISHFGESRVDVFGLIGLFVGAKSRQAVFRIVMSID